MQKSPATLTHAVIQGSSADTIVECLANKDTSEAQGMAAMAWLLENKPETANEVLCLMYGVACYRVEDSCFKESTPPEIHAKWFVSTLASSSLNCEDIPLANSKAQAQQLAVEHLALSALFFKEEELTA